MGGLQACSPGPFGSARAEPSSDIRILAIIEYLVFHPWKTAVVLVIGILLGTGAFYAYELNRALGAVATEDFDPATARLAMTGTPARTTGTTVSSLVPDEQDFDLNAGPLAEMVGTYGATTRASQQFPEAFGVPIPDEQFDSYLLVGTDASGFLADAIVLGLQPSNGGAPIMVSLPRDLYVWNLCLDRMSRLNEGLNGCKGVATGSELMAIMVEDYTGIPVDHLARINFAGFARLVDSMGGITVCVDYPTRDPKAELEIDTTGCQVVRGSVALAWVRSRSTEQLRNGEWVQVVGSDFARQNRQQDVLFQLARKAGKFSSPATLASQLSAVAKSVKLDSSWTFGQAVGAGWRYRGITKDSVRRFTIEVSDFRTSGGAAVLIPTASFTEQLGTVWDG
jgi:LCP family protein required for cell wall assembly